MPLEIVNELYALRDPAYAAFQAKLIPNIDPGTILGIRCPDLRALAAKWKGNSDASAFMSSLPHPTLEENMLHAMLLCLEREPARALTLLEAFLPYVDNWATCDSINPKAFQKDPLPVLARVPEYLSSEHTYTVRYGIAVLMRYFLDARFDPSFPARVAVLRSEEYYVNMMIAWYFATGLAKQYDAFVPYLENGALDVWTHNKTIQKAIESFRVTDEHKSYLNSLRKK